jgi:hypothetical protein
VTNSELLLLLDDAPQRVITLKPRGPLGPMDPDADGCMAHHDLPANALAELAKGRDNRRYLRANFFSVSVPGLSFVPGGSSERHDLFMTWFLHRYNPVEQLLACQTYAERGYVDFLLMIADMQRDGLSTAAIVELALFVQSFGLRVVASLGSKDISPKDDRVDGWPMQQALPVLEALIAARAVDKAIVGFEFSLWNDPRNTQSIIDLFASVCTPADVWLYMHFASDGDWWSTDANRRDFWRKQAGKLRGVMKQHDPWNESVALMQARIHEEQVIFAEIGAVDANGPFDVIACEYAAMRQFPTYQWSEDRGDMVGYELLCTPGDLPIMGFGGGARYPDGRVL